MVRSRYDGWRAFWIAIIVIFGGHYLLSFFFAVPTVGTLMVWTSFIVGGLMIFMMAGLGGRDLTRMVKASKELQTKNK